MSEQRRKRRQEREGKPAAKPISRDRLIWVGIVVCDCRRLCRVLVLQQPSLRWICQVPRIEAGQDVWALLVSTLRRAESDVRKVFSVCTLRRMRDQRFAGTGARMRGCGREVISSLAVWSKQAGRGGLSPCKNSVIRLGAACRDGDSKINRLRSKQPPRGITESCLPRSQLWRWPELSCRRCRCSGTMRNRHPHFATLGRSLIVTL